MLQGAAARPPLFYCALSCRPKFHIRLPVVSKQAHTANGWFLASGFGTCIVAFGCRLRFWCWPFHRSCCLGARLRARRFVCRISRISRRPAKAASRGSVNSGLRRERFIAIYARPTARKRSAIQTVIMFNIRAARIRAIAGRNSPNPEAKSQVVLRQVSIAARVASTDRAMFQDRDIRRPARPDSPCGAGMSL
jgi:hypothetical protein